MDYSEIESQCLSCRLCKLYATRTHVVVGVGPLTTPIMLVGEGPGRQEDETGEPFVGAAGKLLDDMLSIIDLNRKNVYITNIVKCRPPNNRDPEQSECDSCRVHLLGQIEYLQPKIIVCLGRISARELIREDFRITKDHGSWTEKNGIWYTALYHPSALLRDLDKRPDTFCDLLSIREKINELLPSFY